METLREIRAGNILYKNGYVLIESEEADLINQLSLRKSLYTRVRLTPAIFEEAGFIKAGKPPFLKKDKNGSQYSKSYYHRGEVSIEEDQLPPFICHVKKGGQEFAIEYFHELQNAYYLLTHQELETNFLR